jgi:cell division septal protein FtsQ
MSGRGMSVKFNLLQKGVRKTIYDRKDSKRKGVYQNLEDHKTLNSHSFALFQKEQFARKKKERKERIRLRLLVVLITFVIVVLFLYVWNGTDFSVLKSPQFQ